MMGQRHVLETDLIYKLILKHIYFTTLKHFSTRRTRSKLVNPDIPIDVQQVVSHLLRKERSRLVSTGLLNLLTGSRGLMLQLFIT